MITKQNHKNGTNFRNINARNHFGCPHSKLVYYEIDILLLFVLFSIVSAKHFFASCGGELILSCPDIENDNTRGC